MDENRKKNGEKGGRQNQMCQVVSDLLPVYVEGECTEGSKELVEEHVKTCTDCMEQLRMMKKDLKKVLPKLSQEEIPQIDALRKVRRKNWGSMAIVIIVALMTLCIVLAFGFSYIPLDSGSSFRNKEAREKAEEMMQVLKTDGVDAFVEQMEPELLYEDLCTPNKNKFAETDDFTNRAMRKEALGELQITLGEGADAHTYWITDKCMIANLENAKETGIAATGEEQVYLDTEDMNAYVHAEIRSSTEYSGINYILSEQQYQYLIEQYGEIDDPWLEEMEINGAIYYCRSDIGKKTYSAGQQDIPESTDAEHEAAKAYLEQFTEDMYRIVPEIHELDTTYVYIATSSIVPDELLQLKKQYLGIIDGWYQQYADYYKNMGYEKFAEMWKADLKQELHEIQDTLGEVENVKFQTDHSSIFPTKSVWSDGRSDMGNPGEDAQDRGGWNLIWDVECSDGQYAVYLNVDNAGERGYMYRCWTTYSQSTSFDPRYN